MSNEVKVIKGYPFYKIYNDGRVYSIRHNKFLKPYANHKGYLMVKLTHNFMPKTISIHRLVALNFISNNLNKEQVNHINGIKTDNRVENLEWSTNKENCLHAHKNGLVKKRSIEGAYAQKMACSKMVIDLQTGIFYDSITDLAKAKNILHSKASWHLKRNNNKLLIKFV